MQPAAKVILRVRAMLQAAAVLMGIKAANAALPDGHQLLCVLTTQNRTGLKTQEYLHVATAPQSIVV